MHYLRHYVRLMRRAECRPLPECATEKHHIFPRFMFGDNNRVVSLTLREHFIAHLLLWRVCRQRYGNTEVTKKAAMVVHFMRNVNKEKLNSHIYARVRELAMVKMTEINKGRRMSEEQKRKMSKTLSKKRWWNNGTKDFFCEQCPAGCVAGRLHKSVQTPESIAKTRAAITGLKRTQAVCDAASRARRGVRWWNNGTDSKLCHTCPEGWVRGRLTKDTWQTDH